MSVAKKKKVLITALVKSSTMTISNISVHIVEIKKRRIN